MSELTPLKSKMRKNACLRKKNLSNLSKCIIVTLVCIRECTHFTMRDLFYCLFFSVVQQFFHSQWKMLYFKSVSPLKCIFMIFLARNPCLIFTSWLCECVRCSSSSFFQSSYKYVFRPCQKLKCNRVHCNQDNNKNVARPVKNTCTNWQTKEQAHSLNEDSVN